MTLMIIFIAGLHLNGINFPLLFSLWVKSIKPIKKVSLPPRFLPLFFLSHLHWCPFHPPTSRDFAELPPRRRCRGFENPLWRSRARLVLAETGDYRAAPVLLGQSFTQCRPHWLEILELAFLSFWHLPSLFTSGAVPPPPWRAMLLSWLSKRLRHFSLERSSPGTHAAKADEILTFKLGFFLLVEGGGGGLGAQILFILMTNPSCGGSEMLSLPAAPLPVLELGCTMQGVSLLPLQCRDL